jgi:hypothetical protein
MWPSDVFAFGDVFTTDYPAMRWYQQMFDEAKGHLAQH